VHIADPAVAANRLMTLNYAWIQDVPSVN